MLRTGKSNGLQILSRMGKREKEEEREKREKKGERERGRSGERGRERENSKEVATKYVEKISNVYLARYRFLCSFNACLYIKVVIRRQVSLLAETNEEIKYGSSTP